MVVVRLCYQAIGEVVEDELVLTSTSRRKFDSNGIYGFEVKMNGVTTK